MRNSLFHQLLNAINELIFFNFDIFCRGIVCTPKLVTTCFKVTAFFLELEFIWKITC
jgi:hypothetical protein